MQYSYVLLKIIKKLVLKKDRKMNIFNKKYLSKNNFKLFKEDFLFIINFLKKKISNLTIIKFLTQVVQTVLFYIS